mmetsp:Transcript_35582/g.57170  ORF Transcript_35582/g.57170 Transcript_35582/m.57170 type:complete len:106 (+) Transcript_35582:79-396(+)
MISLHPSHITCDVRVLLCISSSSYHHFCSITCTFLAAFSGEFLNRIMCSCIAAAENRVQNLAWNVARCLSFAGKDLMSAAETLPALSTFKQRLLLVLPAPGRTKL